MVDEETINKIKEMRRVGKTYKDISESLNISPAIAHIYGRVVKVAGEHGGLGKPKILCYFCKKSFFGEKNATEEETVKKHKMGRVSIVLGKRNIEFYVCCGCMTALREDMFDFVSRVFE